MTTYNTGNSLGSTDPRDLYDNAQALDQAINAAASTYTNRLGQVKPTLQAALDGAKQFNDRGTWGTGTAYARKDIFTYSGITYVTLTAHTSTSVASDLAAGKIGVFSGNAAAFDYTPPNAEVQSTNVSDALTEIINYTGGFAKGLTYISPTVYRFGQITGIHESFSTVITGDSLSFNGYGYSFTVNPGGYATDNPFGMMSWAHIMRDFMFSSHPAFRSIKDMGRYTTCSTIAVLSTSDDTKNYGMNKRALKYTFATTSEQLTVTTGYAGTSQIIVSYEPSASACLFEVNGVEYDNTTPDGKYQGYGYMRINCNGQYATIKNVRKKSDGTAGTLVVYGCTGNAPTTPVLTGKGGYTSGQILSEYSTLVGAYTPRLVYYIIGANDIATGVSVSTFKTNVETFIQNAQSGSGQCHVVLISTPPTSSYTKATALPYMKAMRDLAVTYDCSFVDLWAALEGIPTSVWRIDNIHFTAAGDTIVWNIIKTLTLPNVPVQQNRFVPDRNAYMGYGIAEFGIDTGNPSVDSFSCLVTCSATPSVSFIMPSILAASSNLIKVAYSTSGSVNVLKFTAPRGYSPGVCVQLPGGGPIGRTVKPYTFTSNREGLYYLENANVLDNINSSGIMFFVQCVKDNSQIW